ncbi:tryptophan synthase subunit alpha [Geothrix sp. PMB-07]|uniref:tryptophan synthase subunit alpha n=1 Tax=Geothrix sp. PMB-07 TaxID=3068640 RepID=UPI0027426067|nr:tryptophan synthase subunit alpha [Geothrix sp. PMB-07]WLT30147.1 tryptophan synthase subunit alpha [Geothrix sp. PMB-07]
MTLNPLLPFIMAGDPSLDALPALLSQAKALGLEAIEVGLPHSDPIADGPVLQAAAHRAIARGATPLKVLEALAGQTESPDLILFTYLNPLLQLGVERLRALLAPTPVKALLVVDLPFGEEPELEAELRTVGLPVVPLLAPTTTVARAAQLLAERPDPGPTASYAQRFAYVVARLGVTGTGQGTDLEAVAARVAELRALTDRPLAVGFGLSDAASLAAVRAMGATPVIGSALVQDLARGLSLRGALAERL